LLIIQRHHKQSSRFSEAWQNVWKLLNKSFNIAQAFILGRKQGGIGHYCPGAESRRGREITAGAPKSPNNVTGTFFNAVHFLPKDLSFEHGGAKLASCPGRHL